ncbi:MAG TPA: hypothetical protein PK060_15545 [Polaromonas sp.]|nr:MULTISPECIES: hypothetical protein [unclassified Polaromonas]HQR99981.1 hypothetical protein [Polaromonas sp.]OYY33851.1 MAG: hypothetical protein B7Y60_18135 [Polaromonas sp. 35-63-35]OYZ19527.1 MAG: hypothetical protein B7Y28_13290 [Polaromonas sp. 16-63-31]OYZ77423.1 MAG: hypothetical protein B7Y09_17035 [Polaromonas sp. 24-63-21]OZA48382.1 MAG: hypothetical protein B7X88_18695 [Polaromonas sp. 17-63-33]
MTEANTVSTPSAVSLYDARPFFEKALQHGVQHGILGPEKIEAMRIEGPKGMVQIARYFGNEFLRPELEKARDRMVNLISIYLESSCGGDLKQAAESLRDFSLLSRSKGGSDMLKALIAMPQNSHFGMNERGGFRDEHIPLLAKWSLRSLADYQAELARRSQVAQVVDAALWLAGELGMDADELDEAGKDAEAVIRTALLALAVGRIEMPDWIAFEKMIVALRKKHGAAPAALPVALPKKLPAHLHGVVELVRQSVMTDVPKILDRALPVRQLFDRSPAFMGRYFWVEDALAEVDHHDRQASAAWNKVTGGNSDDGSLLTLLLCVAAGATPKTMLTEKGAATLVRKIWKSGFHPALAHQYIVDHAPAQHQEAYTSLWEEFVQEAQPTLQSDAVHALNDAVALLRRECHVQ